MHSLFRALNELSFVIAPVFYKLLYMSFVATVIGLIIMIIRKIADRKIPPFWKCGLWLCVIVALVMPLRLQSNLSLLSSVQDIQRISYRDDYNSGKNTQEMLAESLRGEGSLSSVDHIQVGEKALQSLYLKSLIFDVMLPLLWTFGVLLAALIMINGGLRLKSKLRQYKVKCDILNYKIIIDKWKRELNIKRDIGIIVQDYIKSPALTGVFTPKIVLPAYVMDLSEQSVEYILLHELVHYKRLDMLLNYLLIILQVIYWFNPVLWVLFKLIREDMELANDAYILKLIGKENEKRYSFSLIEVLEGFHGASLAPRLLFMVDNKNNLKRRINMMKLIKVFQRKKLLMSIFPVVLISILSLLFLTVPKHSLAEELVTGGGPSQLINLQAAHFSGANLYLWMNRVVALKDEEVKSIYSRERLNRIKIINNEVIELQAISTKPVSMSNIEGMMISLSPTKQFKQKSLPQKYTTKLATEIGDYVNVLGKISNAHMMEGFIKKVEQKKYAFIRKTISTEGTLLIEEIRYNGKFIVTRNEFVIPAAKAFLYDNMVTYQDDNVRYIFLTDLTDINKELFLRYTNGDNTIGYLLDRTTY